MRFHLLFLTLTSFLFFTPSLTSSSDIIYIRKLIADFAINLDTKNFKGFEIEFIPSGTYDAGAGPVAGLPAIQKTLAAVVNNNVTQTSLTTQSITLSPPFDSLGAASRASAITYAIVSYIGQKADAGKAYIFYGLFKDKLVKTGDFAEYGGWRFSERIFETLVSKFFLAIFFLMPKHGHWTRRFPNFRPGHRRRCQRSTSSSGRCSDRLAESSEMVSALSSLLALSPPRVA